MHCRVQGDRLGRDVQMYSDNHSILQSWASLLCLGDGKVTQLADILSVT